MSCKNIEVIPCCFTPNNTSLDNVSINKYIKFSNEEKVYYYATVTDPDTAINPTTHLGGGTIIYGQCPINKIDDTHVLINGTGNVPAGLKTVTINNLSGITSINGGFELGDGRRVTSISFDATELSDVKGLLPTYTLAGGTFQWIGLKPITE